MTVRLLKKSSFPDTSIHQPEVVHNRRFLKTLCSNRSRQSGWLMRKRPLWQCLIPAFFGSLLIVSTVSAEDHRQWGSKDSRNMVSAETGLPDSFDPATGRDNQGVGGTGAESYC